MLPSVNRRPRQLPVAFSPLCVYWFDGAADATDRSGNGRTLTIATSPTEIAGPAEGKKGAYAGRYTLTDAALRLTGSMTAVALIQPDTLTGGRIVVGCGTAGASSATNLQWSLGTNAAALRYFAESGAGVDTTFSAGRPLLGDWQLVHLRRSSATAIALGINGVDLGTGTCTAPDGGGSSVFSIGGDAGGANLWSQGIAGVAVWNSSLSDRQLRWLARACLGIAP